MSSIEWAEVKRKFPNLSWDELASKVREIHNNRLDSTFNLRRRIPQHVLEGEEEDIELNEIDGGEEEVIDLAEDEIVESSFGAGEVLSEATPLIAGTVEAGSVIPSVLAGGAILGGAAGIGGIVSHALSDNEIDNHINPVITLPGHKYIGPGNSLDKGAIPVDYDDMISEDHDREYSKAKTQEDIYNADKKYLNKAVYDTFARGNIHSGIGALGIGVKHAVEKVVGVQYPSGLPINNDNIQIDSTTDTSFHNSPGMDEKGKNKGRFYQLKLNVNVDPRTLPLFRNVKSEEKKQNIFDKWNANRVKKGLELIDYKPLTDRAPLEPPTKKEEHHLGSQEDVKASTSGIKTESTGGTKQEEKMPLPGTGRGTDADLSQRPNKRMRTADSGEADVQGVTSAGALAQSTGPEVYVDKPLNFANVGELRFEKVHRVLAYGLATNILPHPSNTTGTDIRLLTTSLMEIPWDKAFFYLSPGELDSLPKGSYVKSVNVKVTQRNPRVAFETGSTASGLATLNQNKFGILAYGLNKMNGLRTTTRRIASFDPNEPMIPQTTADASYDDIDEALYGVSQGQIAFNSRIPSTVVMQPIQMPNYLTLWNAGHIVGQTGTNPGWYSLAEHVTQFNMQHTADTIILDKSYTPSYAPLKEQTAYGEYLRGTLDGFDLETFSFNDGNSRKQVSRVNITGLNPDLSSNPTESFQITPSNLTAFSRLVSRYSPLEKGQLAKNIDRGDMPECVQPSIHVGISPVPRLTSTAGTIQPNSWTDVQVYYEVKCTMYVGYAFPHHNTHQAEFNIEANEVKMGINQNLEVNLPVRFGHYVQTDVPTASAARSMQVDKSSPLQSNEVSSSSDAYRRRNR
nr:VP1 [Mute swan feces associated ambidensovirus 1]